MQRPHEFLQENRNILTKTIACARVIERERGSKTAPFTLSPPGLPAVLADFSVLQQSLFIWQRQKNKSNFRFGNTT